MGDLFLSTKVDLTGADGFILALERHDRSVNGGSNTCRYVVDLDGELRSEDLRKEIEQNKIIQWLACFRISDSLILKKWNYSEGQVIPVFEMNTEKEYPTEIFSKQINKSNPPLLYFDIVKRKNNTTRLVLSWHHLLMDGQGAVLLLKSLGGVLGTLKESSAIPSKSNSFVQAVKSKLFVSKSAKGTVSDVYTSSSVKGEQKIRTISFSKEQSERIKTNAIKAGAKYGLSSFYLSCASISLREVLIKRGQEDVNFWIPVPQNTRKVGATLPIIGNHLSFLFYRLFEDDLSNVEIAVNAVNKQMIHQIKKDLSRSYTHLMNYLKWIPSAIYYQLIKGPKGKALSSFLFTMAAEHPSDLKYLFGHKITNAISLPPNTYPPGTTFAVTSFAQNTQLSILYFDDVLNSEEADYLESQIKKQLLG